MSAALLSEEYIRGVALGAIGAYRLLYPCMSRRQLARLLPRVRIAASRLPDRVVVKAPSG